MSEASFGSENFSEGRIKFRIQLYLVVDVKIKETD